MIKQRVHMPKKKFLALKMKKNEITEQLILEVAEYKLYYMLNNAYNRTKRRNEYKDVKYKLGAYRDGMNNLKRNRPDLYDKYLVIVKTYLESRMKSDFSPTIHRTQKHYEWETIDILTNKAHKNLDNSKATIIRNKFVLSKAVPKGEAKPLTMEVIKKIAEGIKFPSITEALEYIEKQYGIKANKIRKIIDTGESIETEMGTFEIFKVENKKQVEEIKRDKRHEWITERFPELSEVLSQFVKLLGTPEGRKALEITTKTPKLKRSIGYKQYKIKKGDYEKLK